MKLPADQNYLSHSNDFVQNDDGYRNKINDIIAKIKKKSYENIKSDSNSETY